MSNERRDWQADEIQELQQTVKRLNSRILQDTLSFQTQEETIQRLNERIKELEAEVAMYESEDYNRQMSGE